MLCRDKQLSRAEQKNECEAELRLYVHLLAPINQKGERAIKERIKMTGSPIWLSPTPTFGPFIGDQKSRIPLPPILCDKPMKGPKVGVGLSQMGDPVILIRSLMARSPI